MPPHSSRPSALVRAAMIPLAVTACNLPLPVTPVTPSNPVGPGGSCPSSNQKQGSKLTELLHGNFLDAQIATPKTAAIPSAPRKHLTGHVPAAVQRSQDLGAFADSEKIEIAVSLPLQHVAELESLLARLHDPASPDFGHYLTPQEFSERFGPSEDQATEARAYLESNGLSVLSTSSNRKLIQASGSHRAITRAFSTEVHRYKDPQGHPFFAPHYELSLPAAIPIEAVHGLNSLASYKTHAHPRAVALTRPLEAERATGDTTGNASPAATGSGPGGGMTPANIRSAYRFPTTATYDGTGQTLAVFELDGYTPSDITHYEQYFGLPAVPLSNVLVDRATGAAGSGAGEVTLDIELMIAAAPGASGILVYEGPNTEKGAIDTYNRIATDNLAKSISTSWGQSEGEASTSTLQSENSIFMQMAAQGQSIYAAAGDAGAYDDGTTLSVDDPATQPYVVAVGGTRLVLNNSGSYQSETTWNGGSAAGGAGGGGASRVWSIPTYQSAVAASAYGAGAGVSKTMRNIPDVSLDADPETGYSIYFRGSWAIYGGTSCASPIWAGITALINQAREGQKLGALGFPLAQLYRLAQQSSSYSADFHDTRDGSSNLYYKAVTGFDDATGLGSPQVESLLADLIQGGTPIPAPSSSSTPSDPTPGNGDSPCPN